MTEPTLDVVVTRREQQADGIIVLDLVPANGGTLPPFEPGAHVDVHAEPGLVRQYSLCGSPADLSRYRLGVLLADDSRGGSAAIHRAFATGTHVRIGQPRNLFPLAGDATQSILIGGGIGITPLLAMAHHLDDSGKPFALHYCARTPAKAAFLEEIRDAAFGARTQLHFDDGEAAQRFTPARDLPKPAAGIHLYVCGPRGFMDWVSGEARALGYDEAHIHREDFNAEVDSSGDAFEVVLAKSNKTIAVPSGTTIVEALEKAGVRVDVSCEQGICGTCLCMVLGGVPDHRDSYLTEEEREANDQMMLCCSRSKTPQLVLDI